MKNKLNIWVSFTIICLFSQVSLANEVLNYEIETDVLKLETRHWPVSITIPSNGSVYVHRHTDREPVGGFLLAEQDNDLALSVTEDDSVITLSAGKSEVIINKRTGLFSFYYEQTLKLRESKLPTSNATQTSMSFQLQPNEALFAGGERILGMNRRGLTIPLYNDGAYGYQDYYEQMYFSVPGYLSSEKYYLMFDNAGKGQLDLGSTDKDKMVFTSTNQRLAYLVSMGNTFPEAINQYTASTGRQPMPPRWALGHIASRFGYRSDKQARKTLELFRQHQLPVDAIVFDIYWFGPDVQGHMGKLEWDKEAFPEPKKMIADFNKDGINTVLISEPFILTGTDNWQRAADNNALVVDGIGNIEKFDIYFGNASLIDIFNNDSKKWFWSHYQKQLEMGVSGFWADLGEPEHHPKTSVHKMSESKQTATAEQVHNIYSLEWAKFMYQGFKLHNPNERPFILIRSGYAGSQRYGVLPWTGDVSRTWKGLHAQTELILQMGMMGFGYTHSDLGGFLEADKFQPELYKRWLQVGAFHPVFRPHGHDSVPPEAVYHGADIINNARQVLNWRYELLPYNYSLAFENHRTGMPLARPIFFHDESYNKTTTDSYLWGPNLFIKPITQPGVTQTVVTLPAGRWFNYWTDEILDGGTHHIKVASDRIPVFARAGSIIPKTTVTQNTKLFDENDMTLHLYYDRSASAEPFVLYLDDGLSMQYKAGEFKKLKLELITNPLQKKTLQLSSQINKTSQKKEQLMNIVVHQCDEKLRFSAGTYSLKTTLLDNNQCQLSFPYIWGTTLNINIAQL